MRAGARASAGGSPRALALDSPRAGPYAPGAMLTDAAERMRKRASA